MNFIPIKKQVNPIAKLLWKLVLGNMYENPRFIENKESTYIIVSNDFESMVKENGDQSTQNIKNIENLVEDVIANNNFTDNLSYTLKYFQDFDVQYERIPLYETEVVEEFGEIDDYDCLYDLATEKFFKEITQSTKIGKVPNEVKNWLQNKCIAFTTEFSEANCLTLEDIQEVIDVYLR